MFTTRIAGHRLTDCRYLRENLTPEWKRAYLDYSACKKAIKVIARRLDQNKDTATGEDGKDSSDADDDDHGPSRQPKKTPSIRASAGGSVKSPRSGRLQKTPASALSPGGVSRVIFKHSTPDRLTTVASPDSKDQQSSKAVLLVPGQYCGDHRSRLRLILVNQAIPKMRARFRNRIGDVERR